MFRLFECRPLALMMPFISILSVSMLPRDRAMLIFLPLWRLLLMPRLPLAAEAGMRVS
jgi:hypothetical protein